MHVKDVTVCSYKKEMEGPKSNDCLNYANCGEGIRMYAVLWNGHALDRDTVKWQCSGKEIMYPILPVVMGPQEE